MPGRVRWHTEGLSELHERHRRVLPGWLALYYDEPLELVSGSGSRVTDAAGHSYLEFFCGIHQHGRVDVPRSATIARQMATGVVRTSTLYLIRGQVELAENWRGCRHTRRQGVLHELRHRGEQTALMLATAARRSNQVLALRNSYHGRWFGAVAITGNGGWKSSPLAPQGLLHGTDRQLRPFASLNDAGLRRCLRGRPAARAGHRHRRRRGLPDRRAHPGRRRVTMPPDGLLGEYAAVLRERGA